MRLRSSADLIVVACIALLAVLSTVVLRAGTAFDLVPAAMLVLVLPGYAVCAAAIPERSVNALERCTLSLGVSLALAACAGLALHVTPWGINAQSWTILLAVVTLAACAVAHWRRTGSPTGAGPFEDVHLELPVTSVAMLAVAVLVAGGALYFSGQPPAELATQGYTVLWAVPDSAGAPTIHLGVQNEETDSREYLMRASWGDQLLREWSVQLDTTGIWQADLDISGDAQTSGDLRVLLYSADGGNTPLRQAVIRRSSLGFAASTPETAPAAVPAVAPTPTAQLAVQQATAPTPTLAVPPTATSLPNAAAVWDVVRPQLDRAWGRDTPGTVTLLDTYLAQFPDDQTAREKMYAALIAHADDQARAGQTGAAVGDLTRAQKLLPERGEAGAALARLTPTSQRP